MKKLFYCDGVKGLSNMLDQKYKKFQLQRRNYVHKKQICNQSPIQNSCEHPCLLFIVTTAAEILNVGKGSGSSSSYIAQIF